MTTRKKFFTAAIACAVVAVGLTAFGQWSAGLEVLVIGIVLGVMGRRAS